VQAKPFNKIKRAGLLKYIEDGNIQPTIDYAIDRARWMLKERAQGWN
jgi:hypothetical protein